MEKQNGKVPGTFVSDKDMDDLNTLLSTYRDYILSHEARLELVENWINEVVHAGGGDVSVPGEKVITFTPEGEGDEPTDDSEER